MQTYTASTLKIMLALLLVTTGTAYSEPAPMFELPAQFSLKAQRHNELETVQFATGPIKNNVMESVSVLGQVSTYQYQSEAGVSFEATIANIKDALDKAGFKIQFQCGNDDCGNRLVVQLIKKTPREKTYNGIDIYNMQNQGSYRYFYATHSTQQAHTNIVVRFHPHSNQTLIGQDVVLEKPMPSGMINISQQWLSAKPEASAPLTAPGPDKQGITDHPMISRYPAAQLVDKREAEFDSIRFATSPLTQQGKFESTSAEGQSTSLIYRLPEKASVEQVFQNYIEAFSQGGFSTVFSCGNESCGNSLVKELLKDSSRSAFFNSIDFYNMHNSGSYRYLYATLNSDSRSVHSAVIIAQNKYSNQFTVALDILEEKALETGKITLDLDALKRGIEQNGRMTLHGLYFDTDSDRLTESSKPALKVISTFLKEHPAKGFYIVGHTDDSGDFQHNQDLSKRRAQSVLEALTRQLNVSNPITAVGVGPVAPVSSNRSSADRGMNRRVELVERL